MITTVGELLEDIAKLKIKCNITDDTPICVSMPGEYGILEGTFTINVSVSGKDSVPFFVTLVGEVED